VALELDPLVDPVDGTYIPWVCTLPVEITKAARFSAVFVCQSFPPTENTNSGNSSTLMLKLHAAVSHVVSEHDGTDRAW
jgi:hypothetical protein